MPRDISVVFVHGIGASDFDYAKGFLKRVTRALPRRLRSHVKPQPVFWADIVRGRSQLFMHQVLSSTRVRDNTYRRMVVEGLGDAAAYQKTRNRANSAYYEIQHRITDALKNASPTDPNRPLVLVGHSLGCHIISSYCWDICRLKQMTELELRDWNDADVSAFVGMLQTTTPFQRLDTLAGIVTMGSNMPLFTFTFGPDRVFPITHSKEDGRTAAFPGRTLSPALRTAARWINFYSTSDLLGFPLKPLNSAYHQEQRLFDREVVSEGLFRRMLLPSLFNAYRAHVGYWTCRSVINETAELLQSLIEADDKETPAKDKAAAGGKVEKAVLEVAR